MEYAMANERRIKDIRCECGGDFTLPDYVPEIRRMLRVETKLIPVSKSVSGGKADFDGNALYTLLYTGEDGQIAGANFQAEYRFSCPVPPECENEEKLGADSEVESGSCRLTGPRRLSLRTRILSSVRMGLPLPACSGEEGQKVPDNVEILREEHPAMETLRLPSEEFSLQDSVPLEGRDPAGLFAVASRGEIRIGDCRVDPGRIRVQGEIWAECLLSEGNGLPPFSLTRKIPFEEELYADGLDGSYACRVEGRCHRVDARAVSGDGVPATLELSAVYSLEAEAARNRPCALIGDEYSRKCESDCEFGEAEITHLICLGNRNLTVSGQTPLPDGIGQNAEIVNIGGEGRVTSVEWEGSNCMLKGECSLTALVSQPGEDGTVSLSPQTLRIPFKTPVASCPPENPIWECRVGLLGANARIGRDTLDADAELCLSSSVRGREICRCVVEFRQNEEHPILPVPGRIILCRPAPEDTLWQVAKRYRADPDGIREWNRLDGDAPLPDFLLIK